MIGNKVVIYIFSPFSYALVRPDNRGLDVNWVIPHSPQLQSLIKRAHHVEGIMAL